MSQRLKGGLVEWLTGSEHFPDLPAPELHNLFSHNTANWLLHFVGVSPDNVTSLVSSSIPGSAGAAVAGQLGPFLNDPISLVDFFNKDMEGFKEFDLSSTKVGESVLEAGKAALGGALLGLGGNIAKSLFFGGPIRAILKGANWLLKNSTKVGGAFGSVIDGVGKLARGIFSPAKLGGTITTALTRLIAPVIGLVADLLNLNTLPKTVKNGMSSVKDWVDRLLSRVFGRLGGSFGKGSSFSNLIGLPISFTSKSGSFQLWAARSGSSAQMMLSSGRQPAHVLTEQYLAQVLPNATVDQRARVNRELREAARLANLVPSEKPARGNQPANRQYETAVRTEVQAVRPAANDMATFGCTDGSGSCFAAGTKLLAPNGPKAIEDFQVGDPITSRNEFDPAGELEVKRVEEVFRRSAPILHLHVNGQIIRTTAEHPFFEKAKGWIRAGDLKEGDQLLSHDGQWVAVEDNLDTGEWEVVYNLRIADYHTYFVTDWDWGFSVWSHNMNGVCPTDFRSLGTENVTVSWSSTPIARPKGIEATIRSDGHDRVDFPNTIPAWWDDFKGANSANGQLWEKGHLLGAQFGGPPQLDNLVPEYRSVNRGPIQSVDNRIKEALRLGPVNLRVDVNYGAQRKIVPLSLTIRIRKADGTTSTDAIQNRQNPTTPDTFLPNG